MQRETESRSAVTPYFRAWRRIRTMLARKRPGELRTRALQEICKRWDLALYYSGVGFKDGTQPKTESPAGKFFFSQDDLPSIRRTLRRYLPGEARETIEQAEQIYRHQFDLLGYENLDYGSQIDWHLDAVHGKRAPLKPWFKIRYLDFMEAGDARIIWELNRHQHLVTLAKAYQLTEEDRFAAEVVRQWYDWRQENPYPLGINWASSLEVAFRSLSWLWVLHLLAGAREISAAFERDVLHELEISGRHIERYLSTYFSPNTHLLGEGVALFFIGVLCPALAAAGRWKRQGWEIVLREAERQIQPDGMHFEQSVYYHVYALDFFLHSRILAACNGVPIPPAFDLTIERMLQALMLLAQAGSVPRLGDDDGGRVFNPRRNRAEHMADPLSTGAVLFDQPEFKAAVGSLREETLWLLGPKGADRFEQLQACGPSDASARLESSGICVMTSSGSRGEKVVIDAGPLGHATAGHGHADALSLELTVNGRQWIVDPGTRCYVSAGRERDQFRGTAAHNTLQVDGLDQAEPSGPFAWRMLPQASTERWVAGQTFNFFRGKHNGYSRLPHPVIHERSVFHLKDHFLLIHDRAEGDGTHQLALRWHTPPGTEIAMEGSEHVVLRGPDGQRLALVPANGHGWRQEMLRGEVSTAYGRSEPALVLRYSAAVSLPAEFATLALPFEQSVSDETQLGTLSLVQQKSGSGSVSGHFYERPGEGHRIFLCGSGCPWRMGLWESDAQLLYCGASEGGGWHMAVCDGSFVKWNGKAIVACDVRMERWELLAEKSGSREFSSGEPVRKDVNAFPGIEALRDQAVLPKRTA